MENNVFSDEEINKFVTHFCNEEFNQFAYVIIDKAFDKHSEEERAYFREKCLNTFETIASNHQIPKATEAEKAIAAANLASQIFVAINTMIEAGQFVMPPKEK